MNFGMDYFSLLTGGINSSTNSILNQYGKQKVGKNSKGNGIQKSYGAFSTIDNSKVFGSLYKMASKTNDKILNGASKADTAGRQLSNKSIYQQNGLAGLYNSYGMNGKYSALNNYGLSSFFGSWFI